MHVPTPKIMNFVARILPLLSLGVGMVETHPALALGALRGRRATAHCRMRCRDSIRWDCRNSTNSPPAGVQMGWAARPARRSREECRSDTDKPVPDKNT